MTNSKAVREQLLKQAGWTKGPGNNWRPPKLKLSKDCWLMKHQTVCFTCKSCWRRSLQSDLNNLQCPFCGSAMYEVRK